MRKVIFLVIFLLLVSVTFYMYWFYYNAYSEGTRSGLLQKCSRKGSLFKTFEGELVLVGIGQQRNGNIASKRFLFSVTDEQLGDSLEHHCQGKILLLHYTQYRRSLPWRGDNYNGQNEENGQYIVDRIENVKEPAGIY